MAEETNIENANSSNGADGVADTDLDLDLESEENKDLSTEDKNKKLLETNKKLFERAKKAEGFEKQADGTWVKKPKAPVENKNLQTPKKEIDEDTKKTVANLALAEEKRQFGYSNGLSPEETDAVFRINPKPTKETLEDPFVKGGLEAIRAKKRVDNNTPNSSSRSAQPFTVKPDASPAEKQKAHDDWVSNWKPKR
jgi:hypothetical protein